MFFTKGDNDSETDFDNYARGLTLFERNELVSLGLAENETFFGLTSDRYGHRIYGSLNHLIRHPREISRRVKQVLRVKDPLMLPAAKTAAQGTES
jgi:hypothetical protein